MRLVGGMAKVALYIGLYMRFCILNTTRSCQLTLKKKKNCSSIHVGVQCNTRKQWFGTFLYEVRHTTQIFKSEAEAWKALRAKEEEVKGVYARQ